MSNPIDPNAMYQGQALQEQPQAQQPDPNSGFHLVRGVGNVALGLFHLFAGSGSDDETEEEQQPAPRRRFRSFGARPSARVGTGSCCKRPSSK